jgi:phage gp29-like protein
MVKLYDAYGREVDFSALREEEAGPTVTGVRQVVSGHPAVGLTPSRLAAILRDAEDGDACAYLELAEEMEEKDPHYRAVLAIRKNQVAGLDVQVDAASDSAEHVRHADLVRAWIDRDELREELFDILDAVGKGFSQTEIIWNTSGREWLPERLEWRDPRWFEFSREDGRTPMLRTESGPQPLSPFKYISHYHRSKSGLPIRGGLARPVTWYWLFKNMGIKGWVQLAEVYGMPMRIGKYGGGATDKDKQALMRAVRSIASDAAAIIPASMMIEFVEAKISGSITLHEGLARFLDQQVSKAVLGQTGTTDVGQHTGTADAHEAVRQDIEESDARQLAAAINRDLVRPMVDLNFRPQEAYPRLRIFRPDAEDVGMLVDNVAKLVPLGLKVGMSTLRDKLGLPDPDPDEELLAPKRQPEQAEPGDPEEPAPGVPGGKPGKPGEKPAAHSADILAGAAGPDAMDMLGEAALEGWQPLVDPIRAAIERLLNECASFEEFKRRLPELAATLPLEALAGHLGDAAFQARLTGETGAGRGD